MSDLFDYKPPAKYPDAPGWTEPTTSKAAAESIRPHMTYQQNKVIEALRASPAGFIYTEIAAKAEMREASVCGRIHELVASNLVMVAENTRPTDSGRQAKVYLLVPEEGA